MKYAMKKIN